LAIPHSASYPEPIWVVADAAEAQLFGREPIRAIGVEPAIGADRAATTPTPGARA